MRALITFFLGWMLGWLTKWLWDFYYWRQRYEDSMAPVSRPAMEQAAAPTPEARLEQTLGPTPDNLKLIKGIGKVIERKLNDAGIYTFEQLGSLTTADLRRTLGTTIQRLADEASLLRQARDLARGR